MEHASQVAPGPLYSGSKPIRDANYLAFLRKLPCATCGASYSIEAAHTGSHGLSQKASDLDAIPLCRNCHRTGKDSLHNLGPVIFTEKHKLDLPALITRLNGAYRLPNPARRPFRCDNCHAQESDLSWLPSWNYWACESCKAEASITDYAEENCPVLYDQILAATSVRQAVGLFQSHDPSTCPGCTSRKPISPELAAAVGEFIVQFLEKGA